MGEIDGFATAPLSPDTWDAFAAMVEANRGIWGGCWCLNFHAGMRRFDDHAQRRDTKLAMVRAGTTHAALVFEGAECLGFAQYGPTPGLPDIKNRKAYEAGLRALPAWRITCHFVAAGHRRKGVMRAAANGAIALIAAAGGGVTEAYPEATQGRKASSSFLWGGIAELYETLGFSRERPIGRHAWVMRRDIAATE